jgi:hypothetical protein
MTDAERDEAIKPLMDIVHMLAERAGWTFEMEAAVRLACLVVREESGKERDSCRRSRRPSDSTT